MPLAPEQLEGGFAGAGSGRRRPSSVAIVRHRALESPVGDNAIFALWRRTR